MFVVSVVSANPPPEIIWLHNGKEIQETEDFHFEKKGNEYSLYIQEVFPEDTGKYTCEAWNELGETQSQATLTVQGTEFSTLGDAKIILICWRSVYLKHMSVNKVSCEAF